MKALNSDNIIRWIKDSNLYYASAISLNCPFYRERGTFTAASRQLDPHRATVSANGVCPSCQKTVSFWSINVKEQANRSEKSSLVYVHPSPSEPKNTRFDLELISDRRIRQAYKDTLDVYNTRIWSGSLTLARRTLEGIVAEIKPDGKGGLAARLKDLQAVKLDKPLLELTEAVKDGGNLGAHFDPERDPDEEMATAALNLIEYLIEYIYVLPTMVKDLQNKVSKGTEEVKALPSSKEPQKMS